MAAVKSGVYVQKPASPGHPVVRVVISKLNIPLTTVKTGIPFNHPITALVLTTLTTGYYPIHHHRNVWSGSRITATA